MIIKKYRIQNMGAELDWKGIKRQLMGHATNCDVEINYKRNVIKGKALFFRHNETTLAAAVEIRNDELALISKTAPQGYKFTRMAELAEAWTAVVFQVGDLAAVLAETANGNGKAREISVKALSMARNAVTVDFAGVWSIKAECDGLANYAMNEKGGDENPRHGYFQVIEDGARAISSFIKNNVIGRDAPLKSLDKQLGPESIPAFRIDDWKRGYGGETALKMLNSDYTYTWNKI